MKNVRGLVIFYDDKDAPIDSDSFNTLRTNVKIPAGETAPISGNIVNDSIRQLTERVEIKILEFTTVE